MLQNILYNPHRKSLSPERIVETVARYYGVPLDQMLPFGPRMRWTRRGAVQRTAPDVPSRATSASSLDRRMSPPAAQIGGNGGASAADDLSHRGLAVLTYSGGGPAEARAAVDALRRRHQIRPGAIALWAGGMAAQAAARAAAADPRVDAVVTVAPECDGDAVPDLDVHRAGIGAIQRADALDQTIRPAHRQPPRRRLADPRDDSNPIRP